MKSHFLEGVYLQIDEAVTMKPAARSRKSHTRITNFAASELKDAAVPFSGSNERERALWNM